MYLKEEIIAEQLVRKIQPFRHFLELVALQNAQIINYSKFGQDCGVDTTIDGKKVRAFERLAGDIPKAKLLFLSQCKSRRKIGTVSCVHWLEGIKEILENA